MDRKSITVVVVVILCAIGFAYSYGWFSPSSVSSDTESDKVTANQTVDQEKTKVDAGRGACNHETVRACIDASRAMMKRIDKDRDDKRIEVNEEVETPLRR